MAKQTLKQLEERKDDLVKRYIGTFDKPLSYYNCLEIINKDIEKEKSK